MKHHRLFSNIVLVALGSGRERKDEAHRKSVQFVEATWQYQHQVQERRQIVWLVTLIAHHLRGLCIFGLILNDRSTQAGCITKTLQYSISSRREVGISVVDPPSVDYPWDLASRLALPTFFLSSGVKQAAPCLSAWIKMGTLESLKSGAVLSLSRSLENSLVACLR